MNSVNRRGAEERRVKKRINTFFLFLLRGSLRLRGYSEFN